MEGAIQSDSGKMGFGILRYSQSPVVAVIDSEHAGKTVQEVTGIPNQAPVVASVDEAAARGATALVLGIAPHGGLIPEAWYPDLEKAWSLGLSLVNGLHDLLEPVLASKPKQRPDQYIWDIRVEPAGLVPGRGLAASLANRRVLMVGTDMAVGKMTAGLEIHRAALERGIRAEFVATGQIGITITGRGVPLDAIRLDFAGGAIEREVLAAAEADLIVVEGQGALLHPSSSATLPLLRGSMPTHLVLCARAGQTHLRRMPEIAIPDPESPQMREYIRLYEDLAAACATFPRPRCVAVSLNTFNLSQEEAADEINRWSKALDLPVADPVREPDGAARLLAAILA